MQTIIKTLRLLYLPYLVLTILFIIIYSFLYWYFVINSNLFSIPENSYTDIWILQILSFIPAIIWLRPRIILFKLANSPNKINRSTFFVALIATYPIFFPTIIAVKRMEMALGDLTKLETINEIDKLKPTKYYTLKDFYIDKSNISVHTSFDVIRYGKSKSSEMLNMHIYVVSPILKNPNDTTNSSCLAWLGIEYYDQIDNYIKYNEKNEKYQAFAKESMDDFYQKDVNQFVYLERVSKMTNDGDGFKEAVKKNTKYSSDNTSVFFGVNKPFEKRNEGIWDIFFIVFGIAQGLWLALLLALKFSNHEPDSIESGTAIE